MARGDRLPMHCHSRWRRPLSIRKQTNGYPTPVHANCHTSNRPTLDSRLWRDFGAEDRSTKGEQRRLNAPHSATGGFYLLMRHKRRVERRKSLPHFRAGPCYRSIYYYYTSRSPGFLMARYNALYDKRVITRARGVAFLSSPCVIYIRDLHSSLSLARSGVTRYVTSPRDFTRAVQCTTRQRVSYKVSISFRECCA